MFRQAVISSVLFILALVPSVAAEAAQKRSKAKAVKAKPVATKPAAVKTVAERPLAVATVLKATIADFKIEALPACTDAKVAEAVRASLNDKGMRLVSKEGKAIADLWLKKEVSNNATPSDGEPFAQIKEGALIGVITFPEKTNDYRDQAVKAGTYTLRYGVSAQDGAHLGVSPTKHFFLLTLPTEDNDPKDLTPAETLKLSRVASGTGHPAPLALNIATTDDKSMPKLVAGEHEHVTLDFKLKLKSGEVAVGFIVVGKTAE